MNCSELFAAVRSWLEAGKLCFDADEAGFDFSVGMHLDNGMVYVRLLCEESPAMLQVTSTFPVRVPERKLNSTGLLLHNLNARLRMGAFRLNQDDRLLHFHLTMPIRPEADLAAQFNQAFFVSLSTMDDAFLPLALFCCSTAKSREAVAELSPRNEVPDSAVPLPMNRLEFN
jgi:hypothetical protein